MDYDRLVLDAIRQTADEWENTPGDWQGVLELYDSTAGEDRLALAAALVRMIDEDYRNPHSRPQTERPWGGLGVAMPAGMQLDDLICMEAAVLVSAARSLDGAFFPFMRLLGAPRWHAVMPNLHWLQAELSQVQASLSRTRPGRILGALLGLAAGASLGAPLAQGPRRSRDQWQTELAAPGQENELTETALAAAAALTAAPAESHTLAPDVAAPAALVRTLVTGLAYTRATAADGHGDSGLLLRRALAALIDGAPKAEAWASATADPTQQLHYDDLTPARTLEAAAWCLLRTESAEDCLLHAVNLGGPSDLTGAVAGALAGAAYGSGALPRRWSLALQGRDRISAAAEALWQIRAASF